MGCRMTTGASVGLRERFGDVRPPAGMRPSFIASDGRRVWELDPDLFLVQRNAGPDADDSCVPIMFDVDGTPRRWAPRRTRVPAPRRSDALRPIRGLAVSLAISLSTWAFVVLMWRLLGAAW
jgi:hypothetical protein